MCGMAPEAVRHPYGFSNSLSLRRKIATLETLAGAAQNQVRRLASPPPGIACSFVLRALAASGRLRLAAREKETR